jgi:ketosteroid isomerase-like protein
MTTISGPDDRASLLDQDQRFFDALMTADVSALDALLADDFMLVGISDGAVIPKSALVEAVSSGAVRFPAVQSCPDEAIVRRVGDAGIIVGRTSMNFTQPDGTTFTAGSRYTHVFAAHDDMGWQLVSAQGTEIRVEAA